MKTRKDDDDNDFMEFGTENYDLPSLMEVPESQLSNEEFFELLRAQSRNIYTSGTFTPSTQATNAN